MNLPKHLLPTTVVGSYPQPEWLVDRAMLSKSVPRTRMHEMWRLPEEHLEEAQDDATIVAIRDMERAGIDIVTDGEIRRESYSNRFATALEGVDADNPGIIVARNGNKTPVPRVVGPIKRTAPGRAARHGIPAQEYRPRRQDHPARPVHHEPAGQERVLQGRRGAGDGVRGGRQRRGARPAEGRRRRDPARRALGAQQSRSRPPLCGEGDQPRARRHHRADGGASLLRLCRRRARLDQARRLFLPRRARRHQAPSRSRSRRRSRSSISAC